MTEPISARTRANELLQQGVAAAKEHNQDQALELFRQSAAADPAWGIPHFMIGSEYASHGDMEQAELALANAVLLAPEFPMARYQLGTLQFSSGRAATALVTWQPLLSLSGEEPLSHFVLGYSALAQDDFAAAIAHYEKGLSLNSNNEALSGDIRQILARIAALGLPKPESGEEALPADAADNHVLLSNYQRQGFLN